MLAASPVIPPVDEGHGQDHEKEPPFEELFANREILETPFVEQSEKHLGEQIYKSFQTLGSQAPSPQENVRIEYV